MTDTIPLFDITAPAGGDRQARDALARRIGAACRDIGDCLMRWSNDVYVSMPHRVLPPVQERYSIAFFLDPNPDAWVEAIPSCVSPGTTPRHAPLTAAEYPQQRLSATYTPRG